MISSTESNNFNNKENSDNTNNITNKELLNKTNNQNTEQDIIIKINQEKPNLKVDNIYKSYNPNEQTINNPEINIPKDNLRNDYYPNSDNNRIINYKIINREKKEIIKEKNTLDNKSEVALPIPENYKSNELPIKNTQSEDKITEEKNNNKSIENKADDECKEKAERVIKSILLILFYIAIAACFVLGIFICIFGKCESRVECCRCAFDCFDCFDGWKICDCDCECCCKHCCKREKITKN